MAQPFLGQIELFGFGFAPRGWAVCAGQLLPINHNQALFSLIGTTYGGNGVTNFALPDLRGTAAMGQGNGYGLTPRVIGQVSGEESHTLTVAETPLHSHNASVIYNPDQSKNVYTPSSTVVLAQTTGQDAGGAALAFNIYAADTVPSKPMDPATVGATGGQPHSNMMPYLAGNYCIAIAGLYPQRN